MTRPDYVPEAAWRWLRGEVVDLARFPGAERAAAGLVSPDMAPTWRVWSGQIDADQGWHLLCDFLALLPWTYCPGDIRRAAELREGLLELADRLLQAWTLAEDMTRRARDIGARLPFDDRLVDRLRRSWEICDRGEIAPAGMHLAHLDAGKASAQSFVAHFDGRWAMATKLPELARVQMSHEDVARIGAATGLAYCTASAVAKARERNAAP